MVFNYPILTVLKSNYFRMENLLKISKIFFLNLSISDLNPDMFICTKTNVHLTMPTILLILSGHSWILNHFKGVKYILVSRNAIIFVNKLKWSFRNLDSFILYYIKIQTKQCVNKNSFTSIFAPIFYTYTYSPMCDMTR